MKNEDLKAAFENYLGGKASAEEIRDLLNYFHLRQEGNVLFPRIIEEFEKAPTSNDDRSKGREELFERVMDALNDRIDSEEIIIVPIWRRQIFRVAAAAILLLSIGSIFWLKGKKEEQLIVIHVPYGQERQITLPDSSKVWCNSGTTIQYNAGFGGKERYVLLKDGDAFFAVVHDDHKPFTVQSGDTKVTVLGTSFEVSSFLKDRNTQISVASGKVGVQSSKATAQFLLPGQRETINMVTHKITNSIIDTADIAAWRTSRMIFDNQPLESVMSSLERKYNVHIIIKNEKLTSEKITMRVNNQPIDNVLSAISFSNHLTYRRVSTDTIIIK